MQKARQSGPGEGSGRAHRYNTAIHVLLCHSLPRQRPPSTADILFGLQDPFRTNHFPAVPRSSKTREGRIVSTRDGQMVFREQRKSTSRCLVQISRYTNLDRALAAASHPATTDVKTIYQVTASIASKHLKTAELPQEADTLDHKVIDNASSL